MDEIAQRLDNASAEYLAELEEEVDALRERLYTDQNRTDKRTAALVCLAAVLTISCAGVPYLFILAMVALSAGVVSHVGKK